MSNLEVESMEWNDDVIGFVIRFKDGRSINVQFEPMMSNHPEPKLIAVIGAQGDETCEAFSERERERINTYIGCSNKEIREAENLVTAAYYGGFNVSSPVSLYDIREFVEGL